MNAKKKQYGQGIGGFIFGLLLATAIIGGILYFLNNTKAEYKEIPQSQELPKPEILVPSSAGSAVASAVSDDSASVEFVDADELAASDIDDASKPIQSGAVTSPTQPVTKEVQAEQQRLAEEKQRVINKYSHVFFQKANVDIDTFIKSKPLSYNKKIKIAK